MATSTNNVNVNVNVKAKGLGDLKQQSDLAKDSLEGLAGGLSVFGINAGILEQVARLGDATGKSFKALGEESGTLKEGSLSLGGAVKTLWSILRANPVLLIAGAVLGLVEVFKFLNGRVEIITKTFKFFTDIAGVAYEAVMKFLNIPLKTGDKTIIGYVEKATSDFKKFNDELRKTNTIFNEQQKQLKLLGTTESELAKNRLDNLEKENKGLVKQKEETMKLKRLANDLLSTSTDEKKSKEEINKLKLQLTQIQEREALLLEQIKTSELEYLIALRAENDLYKDNNKITTTANDIKQKEIKLLTEFFNVIKNEYPKAKKQIKEVTNDTTTASEEIAKAYISNNDKLVAYISRNNEEIVASINAVNQVAQAGLSAYSELTNDQFAKDLENLNKHIESLNVVISTQQEIYNNSLNRQKELEDSVADARGNRRRRLLEDVAIEKRKQDEARKAELKALADQKKAEAEINKKETEQKIANLKIENAGMLLQIGIQSALALAKHFNANIPKDPTFGITTIATGIALATAIGVNVAKMRQLSKDTQTYENGGVLIGRSHSDGGIPFTVDGQSGFEAEGGEYIINKKSTNKYRTLLDRINADKYADGGLIASNVTSINDEILMSLATRPIYVAVSDINDGMSRYARVTDLGTF